MNYATPTDLFAAVGFGDASAQSVANRIKDELKTDNVVDFHDDHAAAVGFAPRRAQDAAASASRASTTCSCGSRNAAVRCRAIRSSAT